MEVGDRFMEIGMCCGIPPGSSISPTLLLAFIDDLLRALQPFGFLGPQSFADDPFLWIAGSFTGGVFILFFDMGCGRRNGGQGFGTL